MSSNNSGANRRMGQAPRMPWRRVLPHRHPACQELVQRTHQHAATDGSASLDPSYGGYGHFSFARRLVVLTVSMFALAGLTACEQQTASQGPVYADAPVAQAEHVYRLAVHPLHNPAKLMQAYQPLADYLNAGLQTRMPGIRVEVEASRDYPEFERKFRLREPEFLLPNPWQALEAMKSGYRVLATVGDAADFKGLFIVRRDSPIRSLSDLSGKAVAYPSPTALAACVMPQWLMHTQGIDVNRGIENRYVGSQESAIMNAYLGQTAVGVTWLPPWRAFVKAHPEKAAQLKVLQETPPLINNALMTRDDVPALISNQIAALLVDMHQQPAGREILAGMETARFHAASNDDYRVVREFVARFEAEVRPVDIRKPAKALP